jgi:sarcosine oxidase
MAAQHDVIVAGLGAMGSATAYRLACLGVKVLGFDRFDPPHALGSSHGRSRIIREAYFESPLYVPLVQRAYELWDALATQTKREIFVRTGGLMLGAPDGMMVSGALLSARTYALPYEELTADEVHARFPGFRPPPEMVAVWEPRAGYLSPENAIATHLDLARRLGAELRRNEAVIDWRATRDGVEVTTGKGAYEARKLVLAVGAWTPRLLSDLELPLTVERTVQYWLRPPRETHAFDPDRFPVFLCEYAPRRVWYGFPDSGEGVKAALHHQGEPANPDALRREVGADEIAYMRGLVRTLIPEADGEVVRTAVCMYTNTPDEHFVIDRHPEHPQVIVASPCSGHGFKFSSAIGEQVAALALDERPPFDLSPFRVDRFGARG